MIIVAVAFAIFIVIGFALNKKWKDVFKSLPWFAIAFAAAVVIVFGASLTAREMATKLPARDQIAYVRIDENMETEYRFHPTYDYNSLLVSQLQFDDEKVVDLFYNTLKQNNEQWEIQSSGDYSNTYSSSGRLICEFKLKSGKSIYRRLILYTKDTDDIYDALTENDAYLQAHTALPENGTVFTYEDGIEQAEIEAVWEVFKTEYAAMPTSKQLYLNTVYRYSPIYSVKIQNIARTQYISNFQVTGYIGDTPYVKTVEISEFIPKTADYYMKLVNSKSKVKLAADLSNESIQMNKDEVLNVNIMVPVEGGDTLNFFYSSDFDEEEMKYMLEALTAQELMDIARMLKRQDLDNVSIDAPFATVNISRYGTYEDENDYYTCYVPLSEDDLNLLIELHSQKAMAMKAAG